MKYELSVVFSYDENKISVYLCNTQGNGHGLFIDNFREMAELKRYEDGLNEMFPLIPMRYILLPDVLNSNYNKVKKSIHRTPSQEISRDSFKKICSKLIMADDFLKGVDSGG